MQPLFYFSIILCYHQINLSVKYSRDQVNFYFTVTPIKLFSSYILYLPSLARNRTRSSKRAVPRRTIRFSRRFPDIAQDNPIANYSRRRRGSCCHSSLSSQSSCRDFRTMTTAAGAYCSSSMGTPTPLNTYRAVTPLKAPPYASLYA